MSTRMHLNERWAANRPPLVEACLSFFAPSRTAATKEGGRRKNANFAPPREMPRGGLRERGRGREGEREVLRQSASSSVEASPPSVAGPLLSMPPSKCTATRKWNHNLTTRTRVVGVRMLNGPRRTLDAWLRKRYALVCPYETLNRLDIDREDIMSSTFRARTTYPPEVALYPLIVHIGIRA